MENTILEKIFEEEYVTVFYDQEKHITKMIWHGNPILKKYKAPFYAILDSVEQYPISKFYSDTRLQGMISTENRKWFLNEMLPTGVEKGLQRVAIVTDANVFKRYYINSIINSINKFGIKMKLYNQESDAIAFLTQD